MFTLKSVSSFFCNLSVLISCIQNVSVRSELTKYPVILVPGDGGSQIEARLNKPSVVHIWCEQKTDNWFQLWLNLELLTPYVVDCLTDNMRLVYDPVTHTTSNSPGVETRVLGFGNTSTVEWLDESHFIHNYFHDIIANLVNKLGYVRGVSVRGAPYDFRKAPNENGDFIKRLQLLVEDTYRTNNNTKIILLGHSMGCPYLLYMLNHQPQSWKDKYVKSLVTLAGPWGGAVKVLRLMASGDNLGVFVVNPLSARIEQRSMPSSAWLMPYDTFWNKSEILVYAPTYNYTVKDYLRFFKDINFTDGMLMRRDTEPLIKQLQAPGVEVHCLYGGGIKTPEQLHYSEKQWYDSQPDIVFGDGDGTVNMRSLLGCMRWMGKQVQPIRHQMFSGAEHMGILHDSRITDYIRDYVLTS